MVFDDEGQRDLILRLIDIFISFVGLVVFAPLFFALWALCWLDTRAPLFRQCRMGKRQRAFILIKFRTMNPTAESVATHLADASLMTSLGRVLRLTKLDELPQLWNVLKGDMSMIGPRPCLLNQKEAPRMCYMP